MKTETMPDGNTMETYDNDAEYLSRLIVLSRTMGRRQIIYEGWMNGELVRIY